jgi:ABC-type glycerol-3-phosphate transport system permease component
MRPERGDDAARRRAVVRRATMWSAIFTVAAVVVALLGAALVAWLLTWTGLPFRRTWLVVTLVIVLPGLLAAVWRFIRER